MSAASLLSGSTLVTQLLSLPSVGTAPTSGGSSIAAGTSSIAVNTAASDSNARIFVTPTSFPGGTTSGIALYVTNKIAGAFTVSAVGGATGAATNVTNAVTFDWMIVNPVV